MTGPGLRVILACQIATFATPAVSLLMLQAPALNPHDRAGGDVVLGQARATAAMVPTGACAIAQEIQSHRQLPYCMANGLARLPGQGRP